MADKIYNESMCEEAIQILSKGKSIARLATNLGVCRDSIYEWRDKHPEFARALKMGRDACQAYWEDIGESGIVGDLDKFSGTSWIFTMKNRFREDYAEEKKEEKDTSQSVLEKIISGELIINK
jgi:hypothetical protein